MAILTFTQDAPLTGFWSWLQQRNVQTLCQPQGPSQLALLLDRLTPGTRAQAGDSVRMSAFLASGSAVIDYGGQWMSDDGEYRRYNQSITLTSATSPQRVILPASAGWYKDAAASLRTAGITGQTLYITQELGRTNDGTFAPFAMLAQGWLTSTAPVSGIVPPPPDTGGGGGGGGGCCLEANFADGFDPDTAGIPYTIAVPAGQVGRIISLSFSLTTSASAANRRVAIEIDQLNILGFTYTFTIDQPASQTHNYEVKLGSQTYTDTPTNTHWTGLPDLWFDDDILVYVSRSNPQAGDNFSTVDISYQLKGP